MPPVWRATLLLYQGIGPPHLQDRSRRLRPGSCPLCPGATVSPDAAPHLMRDTSASLDVRHRSEVHSLYGY